MGTCSQSAPYRHKGGSACTGYYSKILSLLHKLFASLKRGTKCIMQEAVISYEKSND